MTPVVGRWPRGEAEVEDHLRLRELEQISGAATDGRRLLDEATQRLRTARGITGDPAGAFTLAYDAARLACTALLAQQGLRPTRDGGHLVVQRAMRAQFGRGFEDFDWMRRRRNEVEYPSAPGDDVTPEELDDALGATQRMIDAADQLIDKLGRF